MMQQQTALLKESIAITPFAAKVHRLSRVTDVPCCPSTDYTPSYIGACTDGRHTTCFTICSIVQCGPAAQPRVSLLAGQGSAKCTRHHRHHVARAASRNVAEEDASTSTSGTDSAPWLLGFQCNERYLQWDDSAQVQCAGQSHVCANPPVRHRDD